MNWLALRGLLALALFSGAAACAGLFHPAVTPAREEQRHLAALATLQVQNETPRHLRIAFRPAAGPGGEVVVGAVGPDSTATLAPVPAGEPLILSAIADDSSRLVLPPRSFALNQVWTWRIPADASFVPPAPR